MCRDSGQCHVTRRLPSGRFASQRPPKPEGASMRPGDVVDDFELPDQHGTQRTLTELLPDGPVVLFFYPAAMTAGCTAESCHFRDLGAEFAELGAHRAGISAVSVDKQAKFASTHSFD